MTFYERFLFVSNTIDQLSGRLNHPAPLQGPTPEATMAWEGHPINDGKNSHSISVFFLGNSKKDIKVGIFTKEDFDLNRCVL